VIDFGMGSILKKEDSFRDTKLGTPMYTAPEVINDTLTPTALLLLLHSLLLHSYPEVINDSTYDAKKSDVWSLGKMHSLLYCMHTD
jgi:serine/threonine protein kinase